MRQLEGARTAGRQLTRFTAIGGFATALQYVVMFGLLATTAIGPVVASTVGFVLSAGVNYELNRALTFSDDRGRIVTVPRFAVVVLIGLAVNAVVLWLMLAMLGHVLLSQLVATALVFATHFLLHRGWTFR